MKPELDKVMTGFSGTLIGRLVPQLKTEYAQRDAGLMALALTAAAEEFDRAADTRVAENRAMRAIFAEAAEAMDEGELQGKLAAAAVEGEGSLKMRELNAVNARYRALLIELHARVEETEAGWARGVETKIWAALRDSVGRRAIAFFPL